MKQLVLLCLLAGSLLLGACPLQTDEAILGDPDTKIPNWLPGKWQALSPSPEAGTSYKLETLPDDPMGLRIAALDSAGAVDPEQIFKAQISYVGAQMFISIFTKESAKYEEGYFHYALAKTPKGELALVPLIEFTLPMETTGAELASYLRNHAANSDYLDRSETDYFRKMQ
ncbi:MAG: hypothetical protein JST36_08150 [Bacteroidetes bacterium]|nr:hypothetical protein [Bacteroidota bacterium]